MMRLFTALIFPDEVKKHLSSLQFGLKKAKWVDFDNFHLTLSFIGDHPSEVVAILKEEFAEITFDPFVIEFDGIGHFGSKNKINTLWVGIKECEALKSLQQDIDRAVKRCGLTPVRRKFVPHVTLARFNQGSFKDIAEYLQNLPLDATQLKLKVDHFYFMESVLKPSGAKYFEIEEY